MSNNAKANLFLICISLIGVLGLIRGCYITSIPTIVVSSILLFFSLGSLIREATEYIKTPFTEEVEVFDEDEDSYGADADYWKRGIKKYGDEYE